MARTARGSYALPAERPRSRSRSRLGSVRDVTGVNTKGYQVVLSAGASGHGTLWAPLTNLLLPN